MICGGGSGKSGKKKTKLLLSGEKYNSTVGWPGKKKLNVNSLPEPPQIINGLSLSFSFKNEN